MHHPQAALFGLNLIVRYISDKMGIRPTRFDSSYFDTDRFDADYPSDKWDEVVTDFKDIMMEWAQAMRLYREDTSTKDTMGRKKTIIEGDHDIYVLFQAISDKDRNIHEMGLAVTGNRKVYMWPEYDWGSETLVPKEGDYLKDRDGRKWRIEAILDHRKAGHKSVYIKAVVRNMDLEGSD